MQQGSIKRYFDDKGFGFIESDAGDVFFHITQCESGFQPQIGDVVTFTLGENPRTGKSQAENVRLA